jgi:hypothetical protein
LEPILELELDLEALVATFVVVNHFVVVAEEGNNEGLDFWISFVKNHCMLWKRKGNLIVGGRWCFKGNRLSMEDITNNKEGAQCHMNYAMEGLL